MNPLLTTAIAIIALLVAGYTLWQNSSTVRNTIQESFPSYLSTIVNETYPRTYIYNEMYPSSAFFSAQASGIPTAKNTPMPATSWTVLQSNKLSMNTDGTVTIPTTGMWNIRANQDNRQSASSIAIRITSSANVSTYVTQSAPNTGIGASGINVGGPMYITGGSSVSVVYDWSSTTSVTAGTQTRFEIAQASF